MRTKTRFLFLMHPKEYKQEKAGTGRLTQLCLTHSSLHMGADVAGNEEVLELLAEEKYFPVLLYPGRDAVNLSHMGDPGGKADAQVAELALGLEGKTLLVVILDATWSGARKMLRVSPELRTLPRIMFTPKEPSRYVIKQQPQEGCLSTLEATHELLTVLEERGLDRYPDPGQLLGVFKRMQDFQIQCAADPARGGYRRGSYKRASERTPSRVPGTSRRENYLKTPRPAVPAAK